MKWIVLCLLMLLPMMAWSAEPAAAEEDDLQVILAQQNELKADIAKGDTDGLTKRQVNAISKAQVEVFAVTEGKARLDQLTMDDKIRLENALERINAEMKGDRAASDEQQVCWRERMSGTTVKQTRCGTKAEMREAREGARDFMEKPKICMPPGCGA